MTKVAPVVLLGLSAACSGGSLDPLSGSFAGTWGGPAVVALSTDNGSADSEAYPAAMVITVSGTTAAIHGVCPDGTGSVTVTGSGSSASFAGQLQCPAADFSSSCSAEAFTYGKVALTLTGPTSLLLTATGSVNDCGATFQVSTTFQGTLAAAGSNPVPGWDLRFKGIDEGLLDFTGSAGAGGGGVVLSTSWEGPGLIPFGLLVQGYFNVGLLIGAAQPAVYQGTAWSDGNTCPTTFAEVLAENYVVIDVDGDPYQSNVYCVLLGVRQPDAGTTYQYLTEDSVPASHILEGLSGSVKGRSFVVTALSQVDAGLYSYVAESLGPLSDGGYEQFDTVIQMPLVADLATEAGALADAGYVITASAWQGEPYYTLVGTRPTGSTAAHAAVAMVTHPLDFLGDVNPLVLDGYVPVSVKLNVYPLADGGIASDTWLVVEK